MARKNVKQIIEDNLDKIKQWSEEGLFIKQMAKNLGISERSLYRYSRDENGALSQSIKKGRKKPVEELENTMYTSACGYERKVKKYAKVKHVFYDNGKKKEEYEEMVEYEETVYYPPDITAGIFLLKNWGKYMNEPEALKLRQKELEIKEKQVW